MSMAELMIEAALFVMLSPSMAVYFLIGCAPFSAVLFALSQEDFRDVKKLTGGESLMVCAGASIVCKTLLLWGFWLFTGRNILLPDAAQMSEILSGLYGDQPELLSALKQVMSILPHMLPSILVIYAGIESFLNYSLCCSVMRRYFPQSKNYPPELPPFSMWKFPASVFIVSVLGFIIGWFIDADAWFEGTMFIMNLQIAANVIMFIQGLSVAFWIMDGFRLKRGAKTGICIVLSFPFFWPWLIVIGMCEMSLNLRERIKFKKSE